MKNQDIFALLQTAILAENKEAALFLSNQLHKGLASSDVEVKPLFTPPTSPPQETKPLQAPLTPPPIEKAHVPVSPPQAPPRRPFALGPSESFPVKLDKRSTNPKKGEILFFDFLPDSNCVTRFDVEFLSFFYINWREYACCHSGDQCIIWPLF